MANFEYKHRIADQLLASKLRSAGAVLIQGPKWCGKSTTAIQQAKSNLMLGNPQTLRDSRTLLSIDSSLIMNGKRYPNYGIRFARKWTHATSWDNLS